MNSSISSLTYLIDGCVIEADIFTIAEQLEDIDPSDYTHTRIGAYAGRLPQGKQWFYHDVNANIVSIVLLPAIDSMNRKVVSLSKEGEIEFYDNKDSSSFWEKIPEAGLRLGSLGYMTNIRVIGQSLFACGYNSQIYQRKAQGQWISLTIAPLRHCHAAMDDYGIFYSIDGFHENDLYAVGWKGAIWHWNGSTWTKISTRTDEGLRCVRCYGSNEVWICGDNGTLQVGNAQIGFKELSSVDDNQVFYSLAKFKNTIYVASNEGLYFYDGKAIAPVVSGLSPEIETMTLSAVDTALWSFGGKDITCFDGQTWKRIDHPDNPPIR
jgi:hypothetical protein